MFFKDTVCWRDSNILCIVKEAIPIKLLHDKIKNLKRRMLSKNPVNWLFCS